MIKALLRAILKIFLLLLLYDSFAKDYMSQYLAFNLIILVSMYSTLKKDI